MTNSTPAERNSHRASGKNAVSSGAFSDKTHSAPEISLDAAQEWPAHTYETHEWKPSGRGPKADRMFTEVRVSVPPMIAELNYAASAEIIGELEAATRDIIALDVSSGDRLKSLGQFLIRTESVSSSKIESIEADIDDYARALAGIKANDSARSMVAATDAIQEMIGSAGEKGRIDLDDILAAHLVLMKDDASDGRYAGKLRTVQNWIGGSDYTPRGAVHVPPAPDTVEDYMADLIEFANRDDISAVAQSAIVHAQFETIHPFTDGNGRIGRALINAVLRRRGLTSQTVTPLASAMVADRQGYFDLVNSYRLGELTPFVSSVARSAQIASTAARVSAGELEALPAMWATQTTARAGSSAQAVLRILLDRPVLSAVDAMRMTGGSESSVYSAMDRLEADGIIHEVTNRKRDKVWATTAVLEEMTALTERIADAVAEERDAR